MRNRRPRRSENPNIHWNLSVTDKFQWIFGFSDRRGLRFRIQKKCHVRLGNKDHEQPDEPTHHPTLHRKICQFIVDIAIKNDEAATAFQEPGDGDAKAECVESVKAETGGSDIPCTHILVTPRYGAIRTSNSLVAFERLGAQALPETRERDDVVPKREYSNLQTMVAQVTAESIDLRALASPINSREADYFYVVWLHGYWAMPRLN